MFLFREFNNLHFTKSLKVKKPQLNTKHVQGSSNMTGTDLYVNKPHYAAAV